MLASLDTDGKTATKPLISQFFIWIDKTDKKHLYNQPT